MFDCVEATVRVKASLRDASALRGLDARGALPEAGIYRSVTR